MAKKTRSRQRKRPPKGTVEVRVLPKDPLLARTKNLWPICETLKCVTVGSGPTSARVAVVDDDRDRRTRHAPAKLLKSGSGFHGLARISKSKILDNFNFHQVNVWAIIEKILAQLEDEYALGRPIPWASGLGRLLVRPHACREKNAFYDPSDGSLNLCYFEGRDGKTVYTCLSHDIVAHELGHAILDGLKPRYNDVSSPETAGFHEYFGDAIAMLASLSNRAIAKLVTEGAPMRLSAKNVISAIASEFGAETHSLPGHDYLRGAWNNRTMKDLAGTFEEHDWSEILTGVYYDLLQYLYTKNFAKLAGKSDDSATREDEPSELGSVKGDQGRAIKALFRAANQASSVMLRAIDYCPPVDLRYNEYARALLRADEVAYPFDSYDVRTKLKEIFEKRGLRPLPANGRDRADIAYALRRAKDIDAITATPADAYRFLDEYRNLFHIPYEVNFSVTSVYRTNKRAKSGYRPPKERVIEFIWKEDIALDDPSFGTLQGKLLPLYCGGTLVFDEGGNLLHMTLVLPTDERRRSLLEYAGYLVGTKSIGFADGSGGTDAPRDDNPRIFATIEGNHLRLRRNAAMRHARPRAEAG